MVIMRACCCWQSLETGSRACAIFTLLTALANIMIDIYVLYSMHWMINNLESNEIYLWLPPGSLGLMYIELFWSLLLIGLSLCLWIGINLRYDGKKLLYTWVWGTCLIRGYEVFLGIYVMAWVGGYRFRDAVFVMVEILFIVFYWLINSIILIVAVICVISYWENLLDELHGKAKRVRYLAMLENIRSAHMPPGRSLHTTMFASQGSLAYQPGRSF